MQVVRFAAALGLAALLGCGAEVSSSPGPAASSDVGGHRSTVTTRPNAPAAAQTTAALPNHLRGVHDAQQLVVVRTDGYGESRASMSVFVKRSDGWHRRFGPWFAWVGMHGFAPRGAKREGDLRTPTGSFRFPFMFGVEPDPGVRFRYRRAGRTSWWDDDSSSANYNRWVDSRFGNPGRSPESMDQTPAYRYGIVIGYNRSRTPGLGSAIFLHVTHDSATTGCVAIGEQRLVRVLRWLRPGRNPRIIMGTKAAVSQG